MITKENLKEFLQKLNFIPDKSGEIFTKNYQRDNTLVNFKSQKIIYPKELICGDKTSSNFDHPENFVVLECIDRLLTSGYAPSNLEIERKWKLGRDQKSGKADIIVKDNQGSTYMIIECKTFGMEYKKELSKMRENGGQLFSYYQQETSAKFLLLYTADFDSNTPKNEFFAIDLSDDEKISKNTDKTYENATNNIEKFQVWRDTYEYDGFSVGVFDSKPFNIKQNQKTLRSLQEITLSDVGGKYNEFATIMRKYNISGRENAFDKLLNLFLCKIIDELENSNELKFNYRGKRYDDIYAFSDRLQQLYQKGMMKFLQKEIAYVSDEQIQDAFKFLKKDPDETKKTIEKYFRELKFYTNNDFAFIEVYNEELFKKNVKILTEVVEMFENIRLTNSEHNQFLGDLFEGFLDQGIKQSEGQFFTPLPIVKFIIQSLPIEQILKENEDVRVIDYACGAGHFINEYASFIKTHYVKDADELKRHHKNIYGIEKESRLGKVSKVASFMYGQDLNIIDQDALAYHKDIDKGGFNVLIANPPYSVKGFLTTLKDDDNYEKYELSALANNLETNDDIQCFFIERAAQIMTKDGVCGIILPSTILSTKDKIYEKAREILLGNFKIIAVSEFGNKTFTKTNTSTVILFLRRLSNKPNALIHSKNRAASVINNGDFLLQYNDRLNLDEYCKFMDYDQDEYEKFITQNKLLENEIFSEYETAFKNSSEYKNIIKKKNLSKEEKETQISKKIIEFIKNIEIDKFSIFQLVNYQNTLITKAPSDNEEQKKFLGYDYSGAKGNEGIKYITELTTNSEDDETIENIKKISSIKTTLYDPAVLDNPVKLNFIIRKAFAGDLRQIEESLKPYANLVDLRDCIDFSRANFDKAINLSAKNKIEIVSKYQLEKLEKFVDFIRGVTYNKNLVVINETKNKILTSDNIKLDGGFVIEKVIYLNDDIILDNNKRLKQNDIFICVSSGSKNHVGKVAFIDYDTNYFAGGFMGILRSNSNNSIKFVFYFLNSKNGKKLLQELSTGSNINNLSSKILDIRIPKPPLEIQEQIVAECEKVDNEFKTIRMEIDELKTKISEIFTKFGISFNTNGGGYEPLSNFGVVFNPSKSEIRNLPNDLPVSFVDMQSVSENGYIENKITKPLKEVMAGSYTYFAENDIIIAKITPCMENGKCAVASGLSNGIGLGSSEFHVLRCEASKILPKFLFGFLNRQIVRDEAAKNMTGASGHRRVPIKFYQDLGAKFPSIEIQKQIVTEFENLEREISQREQKLANLQGAYGKILDKYLS